MLIDPGIDPDSAARLPIGQGSPFYGVYPAIVVDIVDPDQQGRVLVRLPWSPDGDTARYEAWARIATMFAGPDRGSWFIPDPEDEVLVAFAGGDPRSPFVLGGLWNGSDAPPEEMDGGGENNIKTIQSRSGVRISMDDTSGSETLTMETPGGQSMTMTDQGNEITVADANGNTVTMAPSGVTIDASAKVTVNASQVEISAGMVNVNAGMSKFSGVVQAQTVIATSVVGTSYTPGAGNIW
ncbi:MAG: phage baseplate assembly protein V [Pseudomonadota bacterium]